MKFLEKNWKVSLLIILLINFILRLVIYWSIVLFNFSDYKVYLAAIDRIYNEGGISIINGNFLFTISYLGYYAKYILGSLDVFFVFSCLLGTLTTCFMAIFIIRLTGKSVSGVVTALILTFYTEFMVFSSVFYTPVIMLFLLVLFMMALFYYYSATLKSILYLFSFIILIVFVTTFFFKPELVFFPLFLFVFVFIKKQRILFQRSLILVLVLFAGILLIKASGIYKKPEGSAIANDFVFFGHTDYGGDGGEGSFVYSQNRARYEAALSEYCRSNGIVIPTARQRNNFQVLEIKKFITRHPFEWVGLQGTKFFRTFGVVPETTSFKVLYTGLFKDNLWMTSIVVVAPVALIIILFILFFNYSAIVQLTKDITAQRHNGSVAELQNFADTQPNKRTSTQRPAPSTNIRVPHTEHNKHFLYVYCLLFFYYIFATIFFGQYQERYRLPVMVVFIIPMLGYFIASFNKKQFLKRTSLIIKGVVIVLFLTVWTFQAKKAIANKERLENAIEKIEGESR